MLHPAQQRGAARRAVRDRSRGVLRCLAQALWVACLMAGLSAGWAQEPISKEYQIKAAYLYNFAKFVEWPSQSFANDDSPLIIGVLGHNPFGDEINVIAKDHKINGRPIIFKPVTTLAEAGGVHILFFEASEDHRIGETLAALKKAGLLTVGESRKFLEAGGMVNFVRDGDKVRFEINSQAAEQHGLKISAQLLKLAVPAGNQP